MSDIPKNEIRFSRQFCENHFGSVMPCYFCLEKERDQWQTLAEKLAAVVDRLKYKWDDGLICGEEEATCNRHAIRFAANEALAAYRAMVEEWEKQ